MTTTSNSPRSKPATGKPSISKAPAPAPAPAKSKRRKPTAAAAPPPPGVTPAPVAPSSPALAPEPQACETHAPTPGGKLGVLVALLRRPDGATIDDMTAATGWQAHSVRGAMSGSLKKTLGLAVSSQKTEGVRLYRIAEEPAS